MTGTLSPTVDFAPRKTTRLRDGSDLTQSAGRSGGFVLGVDLDGVCGDYPAAFRKVVAAELGVDPASLADKYTWDFSEWGIRDRDHFLELHHAAVIDHRMFVNMDAIEGVSEALWRLSDECGVWIRIITHRLHVKGGHAVALGDTALWLDAHNIPFRDICFLGAKPDVGADLYIDDSPSNVAALRAAGNKTVLFTQPYNEDVPGDRVDGWGECEAYVRAAVAAWQS